MVNFKVPALLFAFTTGAMAAAFPRDVAASINEKSIVARDEIASDHVNELVTRQGSGIAQLTSAINTCTNACAPHVANIQQYCKTITIPTELVAKLKIELQFLINALLALAGVLNLMVTLKITVALSLSITLLTNLLNILVEVCLAIYGCASASLVVEGLGSLWVTAWVNVWVEIYVALIAIITGCAPTIIQICLKAGLSVAICNAIQCAPFIGKYCQ